MSLDARRAIEAILMVADQPIEAHLLAQVTETAPGEIAQILADLATAYAADQRGFVLAEVAGGWRFQSHPDLSPYVERFVLEGQSARLSAAALETLAIVAYKQPISRAQIAAIRGVNVDGVVRTLEQRGYIGEVGRDLGPGQPALFGTTTLFLEKLGLNHVGDLPPIADFVPGADVVEALEHGLRADAMRVDEPTGPSEAEVVAADAAVIFDAVEAEVIGVPTADDPAPADDLGLGEGPEPIGAPGAGHRDVAPAHGPGPATAADPDPDPALDPEG